LFKTWTNLQIWSNLWVWSMVDCKASATQENPQCISPPNQLLA
jgi:hypothetical protein